MIKPNVHIASYGGLVNMKVVSEGGIIVDILFDPEDAYYVARDLEIEARALTAEVCAAE